jgi:hypothetical protein
MKLNYAGEFRSKTSPFTRATTQKEALNSDFPNSAGGTSNEMNLNLTNSPDDNEKEKMDESSTIMQAQHNYSKELG